MKFLVSSLAAAMVVLTSSFSPVASSTGPVRMASDDSEIADAVAECSKAWTDRLQITGASAVIDALRGNMEGATQSMIIDLQTYSPPEVRRLAGELVSIPTCAFLVFNLWVSPDPTGECRQDQYPVWTNLSYRCESEYKPIKPVTPREQIDQALTPSSAPSKPLTPGEELNRATNPNTQPSQ